MENNINENINYDKYNILYESLDNITLNRALIILDWDDTILPTYWINKIENDEKCININDYDNKIIHLINQIESLGEIIIITNSSSVWINNTSKKYLPKTHNKFKNMNVISARDNYQTIYPNNVMEWKNNTFKDYLSDNNNNYSQIISIGDGIFEKYALFNLKEDKNLLLKNIKLIEKPSFLELSTEIDIIQKDLMSIINSNVNIDLNISKNDIKNYYI
jgi:hypothetical protein